MWSFKVEGLTLLGTQWNKINSRVREAKRPMVLKYIKMELNQLIPFHSPRAAEWGSFHEIEVKISFDGPMERQTWVSLKLHFQKVIGFYS